MAQQIKPGDVVKIYNKYEDAAKIGTVIEVQKSESLGDGGWITFDYIVLNETGELIHMSSCCIEKVINSDQSP